MELAADAWCSVAEEHPGLRLLVLIGSRATGQEHAGSDWDLGVLGGASLDVAALWSDAARVLGTDAVDVVDLGRASAVLRRDAAASGRPLFEREPGTFVAFQIEATGFWCDVGPVVREAHADVLRAVAG